MEGEGGRCFIYKKLIKVTVKLIFFSFDTHLILHQFFKLHLRQAVIEKPT